jgi:GDPmannose 4,6-dehydratase
MANKVALMTGVSGQGGTYLAELLLGKGFHGIKRRSSIFNTGRIDHLYRDVREPAVRFKLHYGDLTDGTSPIRVIQEVRPTEIYNVAAQGQVQVSFEADEYAAHASARGDPHSQARGQRQVLSGLDLGDVRQGLGNPQTETTPFYPCSPCGVHRVRSPTRAPCETALWPGVKYYE